MPARAGPLHTLEAKLAVYAVPHISTLLAKIEEGEDFRDFLDLIKDFTPEHKREILAHGDVGQQIAEFARRFEHRYFPLQEYFQYGECEEYRQITMGIPIIPLGLCWDDYHEITDWRRGFQMMSYVMASPYRDDDGARVALGESCLEYLPRSLLERVPQGGFGYDEFQETLKGTRFEALIRWAQRMGHNSTGNLFLDEDEESLNSSGQYPDWSKQNVQELTSEWQQAQVILQKIDELSDYLEADPEEHFAELLDMLEGRPYATTTRRYKEGVQLEMVFAY